jgi:signal transduction histidine kinase/CheY-like chemotaxis protein
VTKKSFIDRFFTDKAIKEKLIWVTMMTTAFSLVAASSIFFINEYLQFHRNLVNTIRAVAEVTGANSTAALAFNHEVDAKNVLKALGMQDDILSAALYNKEGALFASYQRPSAEGIVIPEMFSGFGHQFTSAHMMLNHPVILEKEIIGAVYIQCSLKAMYVKLGGYVLIVVVALLLALLVAYGVSNRLQRTISQPILELAYTARRVTEESDFSVRAPGDSHDELGELTRWFNTMLAQVQSSEHLSALQVEELQSEIAKRKRVQESEQELQSQLARSQRMESLGILAGGVAHDLNNILGPLVAYPDMIADQLPANSKILNDIQLIKDSALQASAVVQDLLTLARRGSYTLTPVDINKVVKDYVESVGFKDVLERHVNVRLSLNFDAELPLIIGSDTHLQQVIMNLMLNGCEAMLRGGELTVESLSVFLKDPVRGYDNIVEGEYVCLRIIDEGTGISKKDTEHIFEPFFSTKKKGESGTGLGLAVVHGVVKDLNGYIDLHANGTQGTVFSLYFLVATKQQVKEVPKKERILGQGRILVVDDLSQQRLLAIKMLQRLGYEADAVESGHAAIAWLKTQSCDLVLLDMVMETNFDGLDTYRAILEFQPDQTCVIVTGYSETERVLKALELGVSDRLYKPYTIEDLSMTIQKALKLTVSR